MIIPARNQWYGWTDIALIQALLIWTDTPPALTWGAARQRLVSLARKTSIHRQLRLRRRTWYETL